MDFGLASPITSETTTQTTGPVLGTAQYISPEAAQGQTVDYRSDLYSVGCCLFEMLTGTVPFTGATPVAIAYRHVREDPTPPRQLNPDVPPPLEAITLKAMAKLPDNRYQTAAEMHDDLERFRNGQPVQATPLMDAATLTQEAREPAFQLRRANVFLCYRRQDTRWAARSIYESLADKSGSRHSAGLTGWWR